MTNYINRHHNQSLVLWSESGRTAGGKSTFATPADISGRWEDRAVNFTDNTGKESVSSSVVFLDQDVKAGDWLYLGTVASIASAIDETNPNKVTGAHEVSGFNKIPDIKGTKFIRMALLTPR
jgi:hypothetical protein